MEFSLTGVNLANASGDITGFKKTPNNARDRERSVDATVLDSSCDRSPLRVFKTNRAAKGGEHPTEAIMKPAT